MRFRKSFLLAGIISFSMMFAYSCQTIKQIAATIDNLAKIKFKLDNVSGFRLAGITLSDKNSISDFSITDGLKLANAFRSSSFPADFILNVAAQNPNDGTGGTKQTLATLTGFDWNLYIDDVQTISGGLNNEVAIPGSGQSTIIPLSIGIDLFKFFKNRSYEGVANLALSIGGASGSPAKLKLDAKPTIRTQFGPISYPGRITIIDKEFR